MGDPVREIFIDRRIESYDRYVPDDWAAAFFEGIAPDCPLDHLLLDLVMAWRTTAYVAAMPSTFIKGMQASTLGHARYTSPDSSIVTFGENVMAEVSRQVPELIENNTLR